MISNERIPNNVHLSSDKRLQRALEHWQPKYLEWWNEMGPQGFQDYHQVYLRTAVSVDPKGWAHFEYVKLPEYRWGIFLAEPTHDRRIGFGQFKGQPAWQEVPGEFRNPLRRLIVTQGDTEPASVEQQRLLGRHCPSLYDLRNLFQVNVEEGRHLWAMVYLLHSYFGRDGRDEAEELLQRHSGNQDKPRMLEAFNSPIETWLDMFAFTMFTDRDGKSQLLSLSESALDPLSRTTRFMLTEESHHLFVGDTGLARIVERTCQLMKESRLLRGRAQGWRHRPADDPEAHQLLVQPEPRPARERAVEQCGDLLHQRPEGARRGRQVLRRSRAEPRRVPARLGGRRRPTIRQEVPMRNALNEVLRDWYIEDCRSGVERWNKRLAGHGIDFQFRLPDRKFNRRIGVFAGLYFDPSGHPVDAETWQRRRDEWLPSSADKEYLKNLQAEPVYERGKFANYIAPPLRGINQLPIDFEYVRTER